MLLNIRLSIYPILTLTLTLTLGSGMHSKCRAWQTPQYKLQTPVEMASTEETMREEQVGIGWHAKGLMLLLLSWKITI